MVDLDALEILCNQNEGLPMSYPKRVQNLAKMARMACVELRAARECIDKCRKTGCKHYHSHNGRLIECTVCVAIEAYDKARGE